MRRFIIFKPLVNDANGCSLGFQFIELDRCLCRRGRAVSAEAAGDERAHHTCRGAGEPLRAAHTWPLRCCVFWLRFSAPIKNTTRGVAVRPALLTRRVYGARRGPFFSLPL
eukprot:COSAG06_NODE_4165_length_4508_cov_8.097026_5_plen_111_part_00